MAGRPRSGRAYAWRTSKGRSRMLEVDGRFFVLLMSNGILIGLMYSLIALGFVLVYKATDAINFAQGEFVMIAGFVVAVCLVAYGAPLWLAVSAGLLGMVGFGFGLERVMLRRLIGRPIIAVVMATIGLAAILRGVDRKSTRLNSSHSQISYAVFCLKKKKDRLSDVPCLRVTGRYVPVMVVIG